MCRPGPTARFVQIYILFVYKYYLYVIELILVRACNATSTTRTLASLSLITHVPPNPSPLSTRMIAAILAAVDEGTMRRVMDPKNSNALQRLCIRDQRLQVQLPSYLEQQRAEVVAHCPLPAVLLHLVAAYAAATMDDMWAHELHDLAMRNA